jgi:hypothetical protein
MGRDARRYLAQEMMGVGEQGTGIKVGGRRGS